MTETSLPVTDWHAYLLAQGAEFSALAEADDVLRFADEFPASLPAASTARLPGAAGNARAADNFIVPLTGLGLIAVSGDDAASFLHSQLTNDIAHLGAGEMRLAGYCTPKGRLLATLQIWKNTADNSIVLALPRALLPAIQKRLQMFVLRAKAKLQDVSGVYVALGLAGPAAGTVLADWFDALPAAPYQKTEGANGVLMRIADAADDTPRYLWITGNNTAIAAWPLLRARLRPVGGARWRLGDIEAGVPQITSATQEKFVPQMINFELVGGVNFKKGCYPGQEIVARSQYLGKLKRRAMLATIDLDLGGADSTVDPIDTMDTIAGAMPDQGGAQATAEMVADNVAADAPVIRAGCEVYSSLDPDQPCGTIVNAEAVADGAHPASVQSRHYTCLVEIKLAALEAGTIHAGSVHGPVLRFGALPYVLADPQ